MRTFARRGAVLVIALAGLAGCNTKLKQENAELKQQVQQMATVSAEKDSLMGLVVENTQLVNDINAQLSKVKNLKSGVLPVTAPETGLPDTVNARTYLLARVKEVTDRVNKAEDRLRGTQQRLARLSRSNDTLKTALSNFQETVQKFQAIIDTQKVTIATMTDQINQLQEQNVQLVAQKEALTDTVSNLTTEKNTVYYAIGSKDSLRNEGIVRQEGSKFLIFGSHTLAPARDLPVDQFTAVDMRETTAIPLPDSTHWYKIVSRQNLSGLATPPDDKGRVKGSAIEIAQPQVFWGPSKYLIVVQD